MGDIPGLHLIRHLRSQRCISLAEMKKHRKRYQLSQEWRKIIHIWCPFSYLNLSVYENPVICAIQKERRKSMKLLSALTQAVEHASKQSIWAEMGTSKSTATMTRTRRKARAVFFSIFGWICLGCCVDLTRNIVYSSTIWFPFKDVTVEIYRKLSTTWTAAGLINNW